MIKQVIDILSFSIKAYENVKKFVKEEYRKHRSRKIRNAVDDGDTRIIDSIVRDILKERKDKSDSR